MTTLYLVTDDNAVEGEVAYARKADAIRHARDCASIGQDSRVVAVEVASLPRRDLLAAVFNRSGYADSDRRQVFEAKAK